MRNLFLLTLHSRRLVARLGLGSLMHSQAGFWANRRPALCLSVPTHAARMTTGLWPHRCALTPARQPRSGEPQRQHAPVTGSDNTFSPEKPRIVFLVCIHLDKPTGKNLTRNGTRKERQTFLYSAPASFVQCYQNHRLSCRQEQQSRLPG